MFLLWQVLPGSDISSAMTNENKTRFALKSIEASEIGFEDIIERLYDLGLYEGVEVEIKRKVSFGQITIIQFDQTILALNQAEMSCLKF